jgi:arginyl-tRNA---protein transferase
MGILAPILEYLLTQIYRHIVGYYIHTCKKMRYKADYKPQYVLDPHSLDWQPLNDELRALMESRRYASPSLELKKQAQGQSDVEQETMFPVPLDAMNSGLSILTLGMPGVLSISQLQEEIDFGSMKVSIGREMGIFLAQVRNIRALAGNVNWADKIHSI